LETEVFPTSKFVNLARRMHIYVGIITVPSEYAQGVVDLMVEGGIKAIWNFAPAPYVFLKGLFWRMSGDTEPGSLNK